jgi:4-amino-4-deoxychorismate mutase
MEREHRPDIAAEHPQAADDTSADERLARLRADLDSADERVMEVIAERLKICDDIAIVKRRYDIPMMQTHRMAHVTTAYADHAKKRGLPEKFGEKLARLLIDTACERETEIIEGDKLGDR